MKLKRNLASLLSAVLLLPVLAGCGSGDSGSNNEPRVLKFTDQNSASSDAGIWEQLFADKVYEYTKGELEVQCYFDNTLCGYDMQPLQAGIVDFIQYVPSSAAT